MNNEKTKDSVSNIRKNNRATGSEYEKAAGRYLEEKGYRIIEYNYRCRYGEIDLIAKDGECLVFCEVKYRSGKRKGHPLEAVDKRKQKVIFKCALHYLSEKKMGEIPCRFDVIGIENSETVHITNAFTG